MLGKQSPDHFAFDGQGKEVKPAGQRVYDAGAAEVGCKKPGFAITAVKGVALDWGAPKLWYFPTDGKAQRDEIEVALALAAPLPKELSSLTIRLTAYCDQFPSIPG